MSETLSHEDRIRRLILPSTAEPYTFYVPPSAVLAHVGDAGGSIGVWFLGPDPTEEDVRPRTFVSLPDAAKVVRDEWVYRGTVFVAETGDVRHVFESRETEP